MQNLKIQLLTSATALLALFSAAAIVSNSDFNDRDRKPTPEEMIKARRSAMGCNPDPSVICPDPPRR